MCTPKKVYIPTAVTAPAASVATPTYADADVTKTSDNQRKKLSALANRNVKTSARGLGEEAVTAKRKLLGE